MDLASLYKQQLDSLKQTYEARLKGIVSTLHSATSNLENADDIITAVRESLFTEREQYVQRLLEQLALNGAEKDVLQKENEKLRMQNKQQLESHERLKACYVREHAQLKQLKETQNPAETEMKRRLQQLEEKLHEKAGKEQTISKDAHDAAMKQLQQEYQYKTQQNQLEQERQLSKMRLSYERKIQQLQQELGEHRSRSAYMQQQIQQNQVSNTDASLQTQLADKLVELEKAAAEILREKQRVSDAVMKAKSANAAVQFLTKQLREVLRELNALKQKLAEIKANTQRPLILSDAQIANAADQIQKKTVSQAMLKQIAAYFYKYTAAKQAETRDALIEALAEIE